MKIRIHDALAVIIAAVPFALWLQVGSSLTDLVPIHWDIAGKPDDWEDKEKMPSYLAITIGIGIVVYLLLRFIKKIDPGKTARLDESTSASVGLAALAVMSSLATTNLWAAASGHDASRALFVIVSIFFAFLGYTIYSIKQNYFIGLRLPWTLDNEDNWARTHRLAGVLCLVGGIACAILALLIKPDYMAPIFISTGISYLVIPGIYSFIIFRKQTP